MYLHGFKNECSQFKNNVANILLVIVQLEKGSIINQI